MRYCFGIVVGPLLSFAVLLSRDDCGSLAAQEGGPYSALESSSASRDHQTHLLLVSSPGCSLDVGSQSEPELYRLTWNRFAGVLA